MLTRSSKHEWLLYCNLLGNMILYLNGLAIRTCRIRRKRRTWRRLLEKPCWGINSINNYWSFLSCYEDCIGFYSIWKIIEFRFRFVLDFWMYRDNPFVDGWIPVSRFQRRYRWRDHRFDTYLAGNPSCGRRVRLGIARVCLFRIRVCRVENLQWFFDWILFGGVSRILLLACGYLCLGCRDLGELELKIP